MDSTLEQCLIIGNEGNGTLKVLDISADDSACFSTPHSLSIGGMDSAQAIVTLDSSVASTWNAIHSITSNDPDEKVYLKVEPGPCIPPLMGDATLDGSMDVLDALAIANDIIGVKKPQGGAICFADCNRDQTINIIDTLNIANVIVGIIPNFQAQCAGMSQ